MYVGYSFGFVLILVFIVIYGKFIDGVIIIGYVYIKFFGFVGLVVFVVEYVVMGNFFFDCFSGYVVV